MPKYNAALMSIDPSETRRYAGLNKAPNFNKKTILEACREVLYISEPKGIWEVYDYDAKNGIVLADKPFKLEGKKVTKHLCRATKLPSSLLQSAKLLKKKSPVVSKMENIR